jgi:hypothetical protein
MVALENPSKLKYSANENYHDLKLVQSEERLRGNIYS